ncbi:MAG: 3-methylornithine--L-lysine ligase PylC [Methanomassiliicoccaceae archaeon]|jgi:pyrrolysine biosynthesis protein PylC|nr:3-methylornithine--L-lysine ligase PylC [Methanomassiliicoccaceae archaeon]
MRIAIVGGALQGTESVYLAKKAGYETFVIDKRDNAPALSLADDHAVLDPVFSEKEAMRIFNDCDVVLPACEDLTLLCSLVNMMRSSEIPLLFDMDSYILSSSKSASNQMMEAAGIPLPRKWPECGFPAIVKPSSQSGSVGVSVAYDENDVSAGIDDIIKMGDQPVIQEFVSVKGVSIEAIGNGREFRSFVTTEIMISGNYDCKRVRCTPDLLSAEKEREFREIAERAAVYMNLKALMDVEAIDTRNGLRVLEIDARIPSQTPAAVLAATGVNILEELVRSRFGTFGGDIKNGASSYEHFLIKDKKLITCGEKEFALVVSPKIEKGLFGADEFISDHRSGAEEWRGTMINGAATDAELERKRARCIERIMKECGLNEFVDVSPEMM